MSAAPARAAHASRTRRLARLLELLKGADSVELKLTVPEPNQRSTVAALELDPLEAQIRQVFFFDTPELDLDAHGVVVRARRIQGKGGDSIVKLRPVVPSELPAELRRSARLPRRGGRASRRVRLLRNAEGRARLGRTCCRAASGKLPLRKLFSKEQRQLFAAHAPEGIGLDDLTVLGPIFVLKLRFVPPEPRAQARRPRCGSTRTARASSSCRRGARRRRRSRSPPRLVPFSPSAASTSRASRRRRRARRSSTSRGSAAASDERDSTASSRAGSGAPSARASAPPRTLSPRSRPSASQESDEVYLLSRGERRVGEGPRRPDGREAARGGRRRRARAVASRAQGRRSRSAPPTWQRCSTRSASPARSSRATRTPSSSWSPSSCFPSRPSRTSPSTSAESTTARRLHGGAVGGHGRAPDHAHDRRRGRGSRARRRDRRESSASPAGRTSASRAG